MPKASSARAHHCAARENLVSFQFALTLLKQGGERGVGTHTHTHVIFVLLHCPREKSWLLPPDVTRLSLPGARRGTERLLPGRASLPAVLPEPGRLLLGPAALPHSGLGLPAPVLPSPLSAVVSTILSEPGLSLLPLVGPLPLHQLHPSASAGSMALAEVALRGGGPPVTVAPGPEPRPPAGVPGGASAAARARRRCCRARGRAPGDAPGPPRPGGPPGEPLVLISGLPALENAFNEMPPRGARTGTTIHTGYLYTVKKKTQIRSK